MSNFSSLAPQTEKHLVVGKLKERRCLTKNGERTYFISIAFEENVSYTTGDSLAIYPENENFQVIEFLNALNLAQDFVLYDEITAFEFIKKKTALNKWSSKLSALLFNEPKLPEHLKDLDPISILKNLTLSTELAKEVILNLPPQLPRYYSIASSPTKDPRTIELLVSLNAFEVNGQLQYGVASSFLCKNLEIGSQLFCFIHKADHFRLPEDDRPIIMIGPGTGVAPFRAFIQQRVFKKQHLNWLFFGERNAQSDFYFEEEFKDYQDSSNLKLSVAFSRDQEHKVYVQDRLFEQKHELYQWLKKDALIYICGDAKQMAKSVEATLVKIIAELEGIDEKEALKMLRAWRKEGRYNLDVY
jgi:sulfite reductase (NADPH) flavoprotein alpha-component